MNTSTTLNKNNTISPGPYHLLLVWLILIGLFSMIAIITWYEGLLVLVYATDKSYLCYVITLLFLIVLVHCARRIYYLSTQLMNSKEVERLIRSNPDVSLHMAGREVHLNGEQALPDCVVTDFIHDLLQKGKNKNTETDENHPVTDLIEVYQSKLKGPHEFGWYSADLMLKLGLLGTIIGFILMLGSVANITDFDVTTMQSILRNMGNGMGTALYTTLAGLVFSILTTSQYHMLDRTVDELIEITKHLTQVYILPRIN